MMKKQSIWISYDLGIKGDYPGLYKWLDTYKAKECGNSVAYLKYSYHSNFEEELKDDLNNNIDFSNGDRIYVIFSKKNENGKVNTVGKFIIGNRKGAPWEGYAPLDENTLDW